MVAMMYDYIRVCEGHPACEAYKGVWGHAPPGNFFENRY